MKSMETMLDQSRITLTKAMSDPQLSAALALRGYGAEQLQEGLMLCEVARETMRTEGSARFSKVSAAQTLLQSWKDVKLQYNHDVNMARVALKKYNGSQYFLQLNGTATTNFDRWYAQAHEFYLGLQSQPQLHEVITKQGLTAERIEMGIQSLRSLDELRSQQKSQKGSASRSRQQRDQALETFKRWMSAFRQFARLTFAKTPSHLVTLGLEPASPKTTRKVAVFQPAANTVEPAAAQTFAQ